MRREALRVLKPWLKRYRRDLVLAVFAAMVVQALGIVLPLVARWGIHQIRGARSGSMALLPWASRSAKHAIHGGATADGIASASSLFWTLAAVMLGITLVRSAAKWIQSAFGDRLGHRVLAHVRVEMYRHMQHLSMGYFDRRPSGKIMIRFIGDSGALRTWLARTVVAVPADILAVVLIPIAILTIQPLLALAMVVPLALTVPVLLAVNPCARRRTREGRGHQSRLCGILGETIANIRFLKAFRLEEESQRQIDEKIVSIADVGVRRAYLDATIQAVSLGLTTLAVSAVVLLGAWQLVQGTIQSGDLLAVVWLTLHIRGPFNRLSRANVIHQRAVVALDRIAALLNRKAEPGWASDLTAYSGPGKAIDLTKVGYKDSSGEWVFRRLTERFTGPGLVCVDDGGSGAGRILLDILMRVRRPHRGRIHLDGADVRMLRVPDIRAEMGFVEGAELGTARLLDVLTLHAGQDTFVDRLTDAWQQTTDLAPEASLAQVLATSQECRLKGSYAPALPLDWRLRLALSLGRLDDPPILLLDEPFANCSSELRVRLGDWLTVLAERRLIIAVTQDARLGELSSQNLRLAAPSRRSPPSTAAQDVTLLISTRGAAAFSHLTGPSTRKAAAPFGTVSP